MKYRMVVVFGVSIAAVVLQSKFAQASPNVCAALNGEVVTVEGTTIQRIFDRAHDQYSFVLSQPSMCGSQIREITVHGKGQPPCDEGSLARVTGRFGYVVDDAARALTGNLLVAGPVRCY